MTDWWNEGWQRCGYRIGEELKDEDKLGLKDAFLFLHKVTTLCFPQKLFSLNYFLGRLLASEFCQFLPFHFVYVFTSFYLSSARALLSTYSRGNRIRVQLISPCFQTIPSCSLRFWLNRSQPSPSQLFPHPAATSLAPSSWLFSINVDEVRHLAGGNSHFKMLMAAPWWQPQQEGRENSSPAFQNRRGTPIDESSQRAATQPIVAASAYAWLHPWCHSCRPCHPRPEHSSV